MSEIPLVLYILLAFLEALGIFIFTFVFSKVNLTKQELLVFSVVFAVLTLLLRKLPISFGIHSLILICVTGGLLSYYYKQKLSIMLISLIIVFAIIYVSELLVVLIFSKVLLVNYIETILSKPIWWFLSGLPHILLLLILAYVIKLRR